MSQDAAETPETPAAATAEVAPAAPAPAAPEAAEAPAAPAESAVDTISFLREVLAYLGIFLALAVIGLIAFLKTPTASPGQKRLLMWCVVTWAVLPPLAQILEYRYLWPLLRTQGKTIGEFQHEQNLARNVWMGLLVVVAVIVFIGG